MSFKKFNIPDEIVRAARRGERDALDHVLKAFKPLAYYTALSFLRDPECAQDVAQEALLKIALNIDRFEMRSKLSTWGYRIIRNAISDALRKRRTGLHEELTEDNAGPSTAGTELMAEENEAWQIVTTALGILSPEKQEIVTLFDLQGYSFREISELMDIPEGTIKSKWSRAKMKLKKYFSEKKLLGAEPSNPRSRQSK